MYTSKYWWEVIGEEGNYIRFRHKGHYIKVDNRKVAYHISLLDKLSECPLGRLARIEKHPSSKTHIILYPADYDCIKPDFDAMLESASNRWRKLMGR